MNIINNRFSAKEIGQELVEFAITLPILALLVFGIFDLGRVVFYYSSMQNAVREGARLGVVEDYANLKIINRVKERTLGVNPDELSVSVTWTCETVKVNEIYPFAPVTPFVANLFLPDGTVSISTSSELQREQFNLGDEGLDKCCFDIKFCEG